MSHSPVLIAVLFCLSIGAPWMIWASWYPEAAARAWERSRSTLRTAFWASVGMLVADHLFALLHFADDADRYWSFVTGPTIAVVAAGICTAHAWVAGEIAKAAMSDTDPPQTLD